MLVREHFSLGKGPTSRRSVPFEVEHPERCFRILATAGGTITDLVVAAHEPDGSVLGTDELTAPIALLGPLCSRAAGKHTAEITVAGGSGEVAIEIAQAR